MVAPVYEMLHITSSVSIIVISVALMLISGFAMTRITKKLKLPNVTAYIVAGILIGPYCLNLIPSNVVDGMSFIADIALAFIAFSTGEFFKFTSDSEQIDRYGILADTYGSFIDPTGAESTTDFTIEGNTFDVSDPKATVLEITTNNKSPKHIKNVTIKDNTLKGVNGGKAIDLYLLDNCTISGNTIEGFERPIVANSCDEQFISDTDIVTE